MAATRRQINIDVSPTVHERLTQMAKERGLTITAYARMLFDAAYSSKCSPTGDEALDAWVRAALLLAGMSFKTGEIAAALGVSPWLVERIMAAWEARNG